MTAPAEQLRLDGRTLSECIGQAGQCIEDALNAHDPVMAFALVSGGNDSSVLLDVAAKWWQDNRPPVRLIGVHINTGTGVPETSRFATSLIGEYRLPCEEMHPPTPFRDLVLGKDPTFPAGFPGPGSHFLIYSRLKDRCVEQLLRNHRTRRGQRFILLTGIRNAESRRRMGYGVAVDRRGGQVWVNPLLEWSNADMGRYRQLFDLPVNEVATHLHMSGECLCGAFAAPGELDMIAMFYPEVAAGLRALEDEARALGIPACKWGQRPPGSKASASGPLCQSCDARLFDLAPDDGAAA